MTLHGLDVSGRVAGPLKFYRFARREEFEDLCCKHGLDAAAHYRFMQKLLTYAGPKSALPTSSRSRDSNVVLVDDAVRELPIAERPGGSSGSDVIVIDDDDE